MALEHRYTEYEDLILPVDLVEELQVKASAVAQATIEKWERERERKREERAAQEKALDDAAAQPAKAAEAEWEEPLADYTGPSLQIFDKDEVTHYMEHLDAGVNDNDQRRRAKALVKLLKSKGPYRKLAVIPETWREDLAQMHDKFPNFAEVIDYVKICCALAQPSTNVLHLCILLSGPAGTGKSLFAQTLAQWIGGGYTCVRYEAAQSAAEMAGSSNFWSNTKPGKPFTLLTEQEYANPTFFLDEIDKVSVSHYDPLGALYALLEPGTAREHVDLSWPFLRLDCSRINYIAACNNPDNIPQPLLSRLRKFDIPAPSVEQAQAIVNNIIREETEGHAPWIQFSPAATEALCQAAPRRMRQLVQEALGRALFEERRIVQVGDIACEPVHARRIGFLA